MSTAFDPYYKWLGIPPDEQPADHYRLLGLRRFESDAEVIQAAADRQMAHVRNYASGPHSELSQRLLNEIAASKVLLLDPPKKVAYDKKLRSAMAAPPQPMQPQAPAASVIPVATAQPATTTVKARAGATPTPVAPTPRPTPAPHVVPMATAAPRAPAASATPSSAIPEDIVEYDASPSPRKRPGRTSTKSSGWKPLVGIAGSLIALAIAGGVVWMSSGDSPPTAKTATNQRKDKPRIDSKKKADPPVDASNVDSPSRQKPVGETSPDDQTLPTKQSDGRTKENFGRFVRIELPRNGMLTLAEVEVQSKGRNIARLGRASQKNIYYGADASRAIDGNKSGVYDDGGQSSTEDTTHPWWELDLGEDARIDSITIFNRTENAELVNRLDGFSLIVLDKNRKVVFRQDGMSAPEHNVTVVLGQDKSSLAGKGTNDTDTKAAKTLNLLAKVDPVRDAKIGTWKMERGALTSGAGTAIDIPYTVPDEYDLTMVVERPVGLGDPSSIILNLWNGKAPFRVILDHYADGGGGLDYIDGIDWIRNATNYKGQRYLKEGASSTVRYIVRQTGVKVLVDNKTAIDWKGDRSQLSNQWAPSVPTDRDHVQIYTFAPHRISKLELRSIGSSDDVAEESMPRVAVRPAKPVNLFKYIDTNSPDFQRDWQMDGSTLVSKPGAWRRLQFSYTAPEEYDVKVVSERQGAVGSLGWGLWSGNTQFSLFVDAVLPGHRGAGLLAVDGKEWFDNETYVDQMFFQKGEPSTVTCSVRRGGVTVQVGGNKIIDWKGDRSRLSSHPAWIITTPGALEFRAEAPFRVTRLELIPYGGKSTTPMDDMPSFREAKPLTKAPVPDAAVQKESLTLLKDLYKDDYAKAKTSTKKFELAKKLFDLGRASHDDAAGRYVLFREAANLAIDVGDAKATMDVAYELIRQFEVDSVALRTEFLLAVAKNVREPDAQRYMVEQASVIIEDALAIDRYDSANKLLKLASAAAAKTKDQVLVKQVREGSKRFDDMQATYRQAEVALQTLQKSPDDAEANLGAGKYYCLTKDDWQRGLPLLAKGSDQALAAIAKRDLAAPETAEDQVKLADDWWEVAASADKAQQSLIKARAAHWYEQAMPDLKGLEKARVAKRLEESPAEGGSGSGHGSTSVEIVEARLIAAGQSYDLTDKVRSMMKNGRVAFFAHLGLLGRDPAPGAPKQFEVKYRVQGIVTTRTFGEGQFVLLDVPNRYASLAKRTRGFRVIDAYTAVPPNAVECTPQIIELMKTPNPHYDSGKVFGRDIAFGVYKRLYLRYIKDNQIFCESFTDDSNVVLGSGQPFTLP